MVGLGRRPKMSWPTNFPLYVGPQEEVSSGAARRGAVLLGVGRCDAGYYPTQPATAPPPPPLLPAAPLRALAVRPTLVVRARVLAVLRIASGGGGLDRNAAGRHRRTQTPRRLQWAAAAELCLGPPSCPRYRAMPFLKTLQEVRKCKESECGQKKGQLRMSSWRSVVTTILKGFPPPPPAAFR
jgi:hypothetical protein